MDVIHVTISKDTDLAVASGTLFSGQDWITEFTDTFRSAVSLQKIGGRKSTMSSPLAAATGADSAMGQAEEATKFTGEQHI